MQDEEYKNQRMGEYAKMFADADANGDGVLDLAEFQAFSRAGVAKGRSEGHFVDDSEEKMARSYAIANQITPGVDGVSMADMGASMPIYHTKFNELKTADGL